MIAVTGADGFIGSHLVETLLRQGHRVRALAQYNSFGKAGWLDNVPPELRPLLTVEFGDVRDPFQMRDFVRGAERVCHLASLIAIPYSYRAPNSYVETNVNGTLNLLQAAREANVTRFVHLSTSEVYGTAITAPISENHPLTAQSPYAATKIAADQLALSFFRSFDLPVVIARPFNTYGPRQSLRAVIPSIIVQALSNSGPLSLGTLESTRDLSFVEDTAGALAHMTISDSGIGEVVNISSNFEISVGEIVTEVGEILGTSLAVSADVGRIRPPQSEVFRLWGDNSKFREMFEWRPRLEGRAGFRRGLEKTVSWFSDESRHNKGDRTRYESYET